MPASHPFRRAVLATVIVGSLLCPPASRAVAQESSDITLTLVGQPTWHGRDDPLGLRVRVANEGLSTLEGFRLQIRAYSRTSSRSELHENFEIDPLRLELSSLPVDRPDIVIAPGTSTVVEVDAPLAALSSIAGGEQGVYPVTVTVTDSAGFTALDTVTTQLLYFPDEVEVPLNAVVMWPLTEIPSRRAGGVFVANDDDVVPIERAVAEDGWLTGILDALDSRNARGVRLGLVPGPRLIEELADMSDGFRREEGSTVRTLVASNPAAERAADVLGRLRASFGRTTLQPIHMPYALPDLTSIDDFEQLSAHVSSAEAVLEDVLDIPPESGWLFAPGGRVDEVTLERLRSSDVAASTVFSPDALEPEALDALSTCRQDFVGITYTCPIKVTTPAGTTRGYVLDNDLQQRFGALVTSPGDVGEMQKLLAELAMIHLELPGTAERVVAMAVPPLWHPSRSVAAKFVRTLATAPWIRTRTPRSGLHLGIGAIERELVTTAPRPRDEPDEAYASAVDEAADVVESFARLRPPIALVQRLRRDVLISQSLLWWGDDPQRTVLGASFASSAQKEVQNELDKIKIVGRTEITLASKRGTLPLSLQNSNDYPVTLEVHIESSDRDLELTQRTLEQTFEPGTTPLSVQIRSEASGRYPVRIRVTASDGFEVFETSISITSTEFNEIALGITVGALLFLVVFTLVRGSRRRRTAAAEGDA
jgi:Family of unknown function (DUF6049)